MHSCRRYVTKLSVPDPESAKRNLFNLKPGLVCAYVRGHTYARRMQS